ncbi:MAG TPA: GntR family transcriptional regulator [Epulopiscium sp.]|nr:GntR family transcriptional regulator [Candidatus Epulonipiscium sp.]
MKFDSNMPIYIQVMNMIKGQIVSGELQSEDKLPSVRDLAVLLKVNPNTIQRTYQELEREGLAITQRGLGRYVVADMERTEMLRSDMCGELIKGFLGEMTALGFSQKEIVEMLKRDIEIITNKVQL